MEQRRAKLPPSNRARDWRVLHYINELYWHVDIVIGCLNEMNIFFCLHRKHHSGCYKISTDYWASDICQQVLWQFYHIMLYVNKPQMLVWIRTPPLFDFQEMIFNVEDKAVCVYFGKCIFAFFTKRWIQFLEKNEDYIKNIF